MIRKLCLGAESLLGRFLNLFKHYIDEAAEKHGRHKMSLILQFISQLIFLVVVFYQKTHAYIPQSTLLFYRSLTTVVVCLIISDIYGIGINIENSSSFRWLTFRSLIICFQQTLYYYFITQISVAQVILIASSGPILIFILDYLINHININKKEILGCLITMMGVAVVIKPDLIFGFFWKSAQESDSDKGASNEDRLKNILNMVGVLLITLLWAYSVLIFQKMKDLHSNTINFYTSLFI